MRLPVRLGVADNTRLTTSRKAIPAIQPTAMANPRRIPLVDPAGTAEGIPPDEEAALAAAADGFAPLAGDEGGGLGGGGGCELAAQLLTGGGGGGGGLGGGALATLRDSCARRFST